MTSTQESVPNVYNGAEKIACERCDRVVRRDSMDRHHTTIICQTIATERSTDEKVKKQAIDYRLLGRKGSVRTLW